MAELHPWEVHCGCPTCKVRPGYRCITTRPKHMTPTAQDLRNVGTETHYHKARLKLWQHLRKVEQ